MNILPLIPRRLNLGVERFSEIALSMREPMIAEVPKSDGKRKIFLKNKNGIVLYSMTITKKEREFFLNKLEKDSSPETIFRIVSYDVITEGYERWKVKAYTN